MMCKLSNDLKFTIFADDTNIFGFDLKQMLEMVTNEMNKLKFWFDSNKL